MNFFKIVYELSKNFIYNRTYFCFQERERDPSFLLGRDVDDRSLSSVVRVAQHEADRSDWKQFRQRSVLSEGRIVNQDVFPSGLKSERLGDLGPLLLQRDLAVVTAHVLEK